MGTAGLDVAGTTDGRSALRLSEARPPSLVLTEVILPELSGLELCAALRRNPSTRTVPLMFVTSRTAEVDRVRAFELGADDYVTKPFSVRELTLRCQALLRTAAAPNISTTAPARQPLRWGPIEVEPAIASCRAFEHPVTLTALELKLLVSLLKAGTSLSTHQQLLELVWNLPQPSEGAMRRLLVSRLRKKLELLRRKLGPAGRFLQTVRGRGYRLALPIG